MYWALSWYGPTRMISKGVQIPGSVVAALYPSLFLLVLGYRIKGCTNTREHEYNTELSTCQMNTGPWIIEYSLILLAPKGKKYKYKSQRSYQNVQHQHQHQHSFSDAVQYHALSNPGTAKLVWSSTPIEACAFDMKHILSVTWADRKVHKLSLSGVTL